MRSEAKHRDQTVQLSEKIMEQKEEIKQLRSYLRDIFEQEENNIVGKSYDDTIGQPSANPEGNEVNIDNVAVHDGMGTSTFSPSTRGRERSGNFGGMPPERPKQSLRNVSNIHQLY